MTDVCAPVALDDTNDASCRLHVTSWLAFDAWLLSLGLSARLVFVTGRFRFRVIVFGGGWRCRGERISARASTLASQSLTIRVLDIVCRAFPLRFRQYFDNNNVSCY